MADGASEGALTNEDRERLTQLLTNAMERGLLPEEEYLHRLGLLHASTTLDGATRIVQEMPLFTPTVAKPPKGRNRQKEAAPPAATAQVADVAAPPPTPVVDVAPPPAPVADLALPAMPPPAPVDGSIAMTAPDPAAVMDAGPAGPAGPAPEAAAGADATRRELDPVDLLRMSRPTPTKAGGVSVPGADNRWKILVVVMIFFVVLMIGGALLVSKVHSDNPTSTTMRAVPASHPLHAASASPWEMTLS